MPERAPTKILTVRFFRSGNGKEPMRLWLQDLSKEERRIVGEDIKTVETGWPLGMPLVRNLGQALWEIRVSLPRGIARILFCIRKSEMILLHAYEKKSQKAPKKELDIARKRIKDVEENEL